MDQHSTSTKSEAAPDRAAALASLRRADPVLARLIDAHPDFEPRAWLKELPEMDAFGTLIFQVTGQQLSVRSTRSILDRMVQLFGGRLPTPAQVAAADPEDLRRTGLSRRKVQTLRAIAERFLDGTLSVETLRALSDEEVEARLTTISGVGPWTAQGFMIIALGRDDVVMPGDLALRNAIRRAYALDHLPTPTEVSTISEPWRPFRTLATTYLFASAYDD